MYFQEILIAFETYKYFFPVHRQNNTQDCLSAVRAHFAQLLWPVLEWAASTLFDKRGQIFLLSIDSIKIRSSLHTNKLFGHLPIVSVQLSVLLTHATVERD